MATRAKKGFTLVEVIVYVSVLAVIFVLVANMLLGFTRSYREVLALRTADNAALASLERLTRDIRRASAVNFLQSNFSANPGTLTVVVTENSVSTTTRFYVQNGVLKVDVNNNYIGPLTTSRAVVTGLVFTRVSASTTDAIKIDLTVDGVSGAVTKTKTYHTTVLLNGI